MKAKVIDELLAKARLLDPHLSADRERYIAEISFKAGIRRAVETAMACDILCSEKEATKNNCPACKMFWSKAKELGL